MQVHDTLDNLPSFRNAVITIGAFDGVHNGHRQIISQLIDEAKAVDGESIIITFDPHPRKILTASEHSIKLLSTPTEKINLLNQTGIDHLVIVPFTKEFSERTAQDYAENFLLASFKPHTIIIGYDHHFGRNREGNYKLLEKLSHTHNFIVKEIPQQVVNEITISSTTIRQALLHDEVEKANMLLGYDYFFSGTVIEGDSRGRQIGFPTANLELMDEDKLIPGNGVYAVRVEIREEKFKGRHFKGMMNIGIRPTIGGNNRYIEVNIFDFSEMIYGEILIVSVKKFLRHEQKFDGLESLKKQLQADKRNSMLILK